MVYMTRVEHFNAAHKLYNPKWSKEENESIFGKCANENWHGHNYELSVTVKGDVNPETGFVMNVKDLGIIMKKHVVDVVDHKNLNLDVEFMKGMLCSAENLAKGIWNQLKPHIPQGMHLHAVKLYETHKFYVEYFGE